MKLKHPLSLIITFSIGAVFSTVIAFAWTGPSGSAPSGNVSAPLNVGTTDQTKNAGLGMNSLAVYGNGYIQSKLGIGVVPSSYAFDVVGDMHNTGNVYSAGYFHNSDTRLKTNIKTIGSGIVSKLRGVTFNWKSDGTPSAGVIAQEVEQVMPSAVHTDANGIKSVEYDQLIAPLIEAVKAQQAEIDALKVEVAHLEQ